MLIKGEKYACEACVRGHRVSNCQHADRPLQHINKKGRPVSQCTHCRTLRKSRSAHVRCDCGEKGHSKGACTHHESGDSPGEHFSTETCEAPQQQFLTIDIADNCCCSHGGRCSCALKKEHLDPVPESDSDEASLSSTPGTEGRRPRALTAQSEGGLTVFSNGHHKPVHKNNMAHKCGLPYVVPRAHSIHGPSPSGLANRSVDSLPHTSTIDALHSESHIKDSMVSAQQEQRMVKSEHGSPLMSATSNLDQLNGLLPPLDLSNMATEYNFYSAMPDPEQPLFSAGLSAASIDWSQYNGLDFNNENFAASSYSQAPSFTGFDFSSMDQPALTTTSTSGEISEVEDFGVVSDKRAARPTLLNNHYGSDLENSDFGGDIDGYRLSTASSFLGMPQVQMLVSNNVEALDMESFMKGVPTADGFSNHGLPANFGEDKSCATNISPFDDNTFQLSAEEENEAFWMNDFTSSNIAINNGRNEMAEESVRAQ
ncbi:Copper resistance CRF1 [Hyphodiscus hymeniophilus]|uniref:Copper resistance CRF1 n=1 Tax=Hyphodiscus hymeniophilus TaxID=353542 RepID=A0A9P6SM08_9HELO|nr:Copper resistance CRF1 [Hyphodiscus hymeniophilus]